MVADAGAGPVAGTPATDGDAKMPIYLDYNGTTPLDREVADAMQPFIYTHWGNPSSSHPYGLAAKRGVETARAQTAALIGALPEEITFMSNGTETINHALFGLTQVLAPADKAEPLPHVITQQSEHVAVLETVKALEAQGKARCTYLGVNSEGLVSPADVKQALHSTAGKVAILSFMHSNNETGTLQPIKELVTEARAWAKAAPGRKAFVHCDASQSLGKLPVNVAELGVDFLTVAGHKLYAPKGVGALYTRKETVPPLPSYLHGAGQEGGRRASTECVIQIVALGKACEVAKRDLEKNRSHMKRMRDRLHDGIERELKRRRPEASPSDFVRLNGPKEARLPNTLNLSFRGVEANTLLSQIQDDVAASAGAACHSDEVHMSHVLEAMGVSEDWGMGTVRLTVGKGSTEAEMDKAASVIASAAADLLPQEKAANGAAGESGENGQALPSGPVKLTRYTHGMGCACKLRPQALEQVLKNLRAVAPPVDPEKSKRILVGLGASNDDACVYQINEDCAIVATTDFFTPVVDDPETFGKIAAANALSDVYAMGATPLFALNIVGFPSHRLPMSVLEDILRGGQSKCHEAGIQILGGHSVDDTEPKYGLAVIGMVHPKKIKKNNAMRDGDVFVLTKPLGTGILSTALKRGAASPEAQKAMETSMSTLNKAAAECAQQLGEAVSGVTDVTGFGFLGHLREMLTPDAGKAKLGARVWASKAPMLPQAPELAAMGEALIPGGTLQNLKNVEDSVHFAAEVPTAHRMLLADAQSSGGLLLGVQKDKADELLRLLKARPEAAESAIVGEVVAVGGDDPLISVVM